ncbi:MAG: cation diffusion facilitator family transporter [Bacteroidota bacterium]|nr:cation diffusion facilitator family transporter [Bacteroidota bacterium]
MSDDHHHSHALTIEKENYKSLMWGIVLNVLFVITEIIAGLIYNSIALLTDAGHNVSDVASLLLSLFAFRLAKTKASTKFTYGLKKTTILAALANAMILLIAIGVLGYESIHRLTRPQAVEGDVIAWVAGLGIIINSTSAFLFFKNRNKDLNIKSAYLHLLADALVSIGVVIAGIIIFYTGWYYIDPLIGIVVMVIILISTWSLLKDSFMMAVDAVPAHINVDEIKEIFMKVKDVIAVHHLHIWSLSTTENALTAHVAVNDHLDFNDKLAVVRDIKHQLKHAGIQHSTIELDASKCPDAVCINDHAPE